MWRLCAQITLKNKKKKYIFGYHPTDYENSNMMILLGYIIIGHPEWKNAQIKVFTIYPKNKFDEYKNQMFEYIDGRLPISPKNMKMVPYDEDVNYKEILINVQLIQI